MKLLLLWSLVTAACGASLREEPAKPQDPNAPQSTFAGWASKIHPTISPPPRFKSTVGNHPDVIIDDCLADKTSPVTSVGEVCGCIQKDEYGQPSRTAVLGCMAYHCAVIFQTATDTYYSEMVGLFQRRNGDGDAFGRWTCVRARGSAFWLNRLRQSPWDGSTDEAAFELIQQNTELAKVRDQFIDGKPDGYHFHRYMTDAVAEFKKNYQPRDVNVHLKDAVLGAPLTPWKVGKWVEQYTVVYPLYIPLRENCQQFSAHAYEALSDATFWSRKQAASSATLRLFIGDGRRGEIGGAVGVSMDVTAKIKAGDIVPDSITAGSIQTSIADSVATSEHAAKTSLTLTIKASLAIARQAEKANLGGAAGMVAAASQWAVTAEKMHLLTAKIEREEDGSIIFPPPPRRHRADPPAKDLKEEYAVGTCTRFTSLSCWWNQPKGSYKCLVGPSGKRQCFCKYWLADDRARFARDPISDDCVQRTRAKERQLSKIAAVSLLDCDTTYGPPERPRLPLAHRLCTMGSHLQTAFDGKVAGEGDVNKQTLLQTAALGVQVAGGVGSVLTIAAAAGLAVTPFGVAVAPVLAVAGLAILVTDKRMAAKLDAVRLEVKTFIFKVKTLLRSFDLASEVAEDQEAHRERVYNYAICGNHAKCTVTPHEGVVNKHVAALLAPEEAYVALDMCLEKGGWLPASAASKDKRGDKEEGEERQQQQEEEEDPRHAEKAEGKYFAAVEEAARSEHTAAFKAWTGSASYKRCMGRVMQTSINDLDWMDVEPQTNAMSNAYCGYLKLQRYSRDLDLSLHNALRVQLRQTNKLGAQYRTRQGGEVVPAAKEGGKGGLDTFGFLHEYTVIVGHIEKHWPDDASPAMNSVLAGLKKVNKVLSVANVFLGIGAGVASVVGAENLARNAARAAHTVTDHAGNAHTTVTEATRLASAPKLARHGITAAEEAAGVTIDTVTAVTDVAMDTKATFDMAKHVADATEILKDALSAIHSTPLRTSV